MRRRAWFDVSSSTTEQSRISNGHAAIFYGHRLLDCYGLHVSWNQSDRFYLLGVAALQYTMRAKACVQHVHVCVELFLLCGD